MRKFKAENERIKREYFKYLRDAKGRDEKTIDKVAAALVKFEDSTGFKSFKTFSTDQASRFKVHLGKARNPTTGRPLSHATVDATLRAVKAFFEWLARERGFKKAIRYSDVEYLNNTLKGARIAHAQRPIPYPSMPSALHAFRAMPSETEIQHRDKAMFAFVMLTGARDGAAASLKLKHINLFDGYVFQDGREVKTKNGKTFKTTFFPVDAVYLECFSEWVTYLREVKLFGPEDALFPKPKMDLDNGKFSFKELSRAPYANATKLYAVMKNAFTATQQPPYTPHSIRKTLTRLMGEMDLNLEQQKAWSQNLGHENFTTTMNAYFPVSQERQADVMRGLGGASQP